ncbi:LOW QUALITY PROTEIN: early nodulin-like protein 14 [Salvia miltiorrhiza]|uniref:LOW QUALITY PROTEIN: early nodulin-like protein 14 n=1 Tax=Salvia miltiorrhiza TaxID=226208 RepID=UPI0025AD5852|nr:LOW QUALITY PROTEIN: early nodulin-like protein 14 [Salvia miltiorrhiza]
MAGISRAQLSSLLLFVFVSLSFSEARDHLVGGKSNAWKVPASDSDSLNHWAEKSRFNIGDSLVWEYDGSKDSVLQVTKRDYVTCNTSSPIETYTGGSTKVKLVRSGPYYFISGADGHCEKGQKLIVVVISERHRSLRISPAPSPAEIEGPAIAPAPASGAGSLSGGFLAALLGALLVAV